MYVLMTSNRLVTAIHPNRKDCEVNVFTEKFKMKKELDSILYVFVLWLIQYKLCEGFDEICWFMLCFYQGFFVYRLFGFLENYVPASLKPFPYVNLWSSSNILLWVNIGREMGFNSNQLILTAAVALLLYLSFMKTSMEQSMNASENVCTYFDVTLVGFE